MIYSLPTMAFIGCCTRFAHHKKDILTRNRMQSFDEIETRFYHNDKINSRINSDDCMPTRTVSVMITNTSQ